MKKMLSVVIASFALVSALIIPVKAAGRDQYYSIDILLGSFKGWGNYSINNTSYGNYFGVKLYSNGDNVDTAEFRLLGNNGVVISSTVTAMEGAADYVNGSYTDGSDTHYVTALQARSAHLNPTSYWVKGIMRY